MTDRHLGWTLVAILAVICGALAVGLVYSRSSTTKGSGVPATQARHVPPFRSIRLAGSNNVVIHVGAKQSVVVKGDLDLVGHVTTEVRSGELVIGNTPGSFASKSPMRVEVGVPTLAAVTISGSGTITGDGSATRLDAAIDGSGTIQLTRLVAQDVHAALDGSGTILVTATGALDASLAGSGAIIYTGSPKQVTKDVTGSGAIIGS